MGFGWVLARIGDESAVREPGTSQKGVKKGPKRSKNKGLVQDRDFRVSQKRRKL